jgi:hypothetical protein
MERKVQGHDVTLKDENEIRLEMSVLFGHFIYLHPIIFHQSI